MAKGTTSMSHDSFATRLRIDSVLCAIANTALPPASFQACARAMQRITCPVPIAALASARNSSVSMLTREFLPLSISFSNSRRLVAAQSQQSLKALHLNGSPTVLSNRVAHVIAPQDRRNL